MKPIEILPPAFARFVEIGGVLDIVVFEEANGTEEEVVAAIGSSLQGAKWFDAERLRSLGGRRIDEHVLFGDWFDRDTGELQKVGSYTTAAGEVLNDPKLEQLGLVKIVHSSSPIPDPGKGGQFAFAFTEPPYPLHAKPREVQAIFDDVRGFILPPTAGNEILDWSSARLPEVSDYFEAGMEWWGVYLFSIYIPTLTRLTVIGGSASD